jgi:glycosyltransferase involved in cell wall biosynthesis
MDNSKIRLHIPAIPYTITRDEFSHDAFTGKVKRFSPMMRSIGFEVYHYGIETSESGANVNIDLLTKDEWTKLRIETLQFLDPKLSYEEAVKTNEDPKLIVNHFSNWGSPLSKEFNKRFREKLKENYRGTGTDIVCVPLARTYHDAIEGLNLVKIEFGIGYTGSYLDFRIFEAQTWMSRTLGTENVQPKNYWTVIPHGFDVDEFKFSPKPNPLKVGYMGRITDLKGCNIIKEVAKRFPHVEFVLCGQGDATPFISPDVPNLKYKEPIHGRQRSDFLGDCVAFLHPVKYLEPFGCGPVEAQLCGTPVICSNWGGMTETIEQFKTGLRCHTLADYCHGVQMALDGAFDRNYIRERSSNLYDMYKLAYNYEYYFKSVLDVYNPSKNGWYSPDRHIKSYVDANLKIEKKKEPRIYLFLPYMGEFPNYFQLYLDSLKINEDILTVFLLSNNDISSYNIPNNLIQIKMGLDDIRSRISNVIYKVYNKHILPSNLLKDYYKFVDFKIMYPVIFDDILKEYKVSENDFVGWGDCDLIYGKLSNFINFEENYGILGGWHGHFTAIKNDEKFKNNFKSIPNYLELITDNSKAYITDEIAYREPLIQYIKNNNIKMYYINKDFCDIVPECFYGLVRKDYKNYSKNFFDVYNPLLNINHLYFSKDNSKLDVVYDNNTRKEVAYAHLQKRKMDINFDSYKHGFFINENSFSLICH